MTNAFDLTVHIQGTGFPILCLHGHPGSGTALSVFTQHLSQRFQTLAPDLRGYGLSQTRESFTMQDHLTDLEAVLERYHLDRCLILGWSLGGMLAMELALRFPERVSGLILISTAARPRGNHPPITWQDNLYTGVASIVNRFLPSWQWNIDTFGKRSLYRYMLQQHTPTAYRYLAEVAFTAYLQTSQFAHQALNAAIKQGYNRLPDLTKIACPCLVLAADCDRHITSQSSLETANHLKNSEWRCYETTAHLLPWEVPDLIMADIDRWIDAHPEAIA